MTGDENHTENKEVKRRCGEHAAHSLFSQHSTCWLPSSNENEPKEKGESAGEREKSEREREGGGEK